MDRGLKRHLERTEDALKPWARAGRSTAGAD